MNRHFRHVDWKLKEVPSTVTLVDIACISGKPRCREIPRRSGPLSLADGEAWLLAHFKTTGHRRYEETYSRVVQWDPPDDIDPRTILGVTT
ncbi:DUF7848 domain-containing protein [Streptomyces uncialis]